MLWLCLDGSRFLLFVHEQVTILPWRLKADTRGRQEGVGHGGAAANCPCIYCVNPKEACILDGQLPKGYKPGSPLGRDRLPTDLPQDEPEPPGPMPPREVNLRRKNRRLRRIMRRSYTRTMQAAMGKTYYNIKLDSGFYWLKVSTLNFSI